MRKIIRTLYHGQIRTLQEISDLSHLAHGLVYRRYSRGLRGDNLTTQNKATAPIEVPWPDGQAYTFAQLSQQYHLPKTTIHRRYNWGRRGYDLVKPRVHHGQRK